MHAPVRTMKWAGSLCENFSDPQIRATPKAHALCLSSAPVFGLAFFTSWAAHRQPVACTPPACGLHTHLFQCSALPCGLQTVSLWPAHRQPETCTPPACGIFFCKSRAAHRQPVACTPSACLHTVSLRPAHRQPVAFPFASLGLHTVSLWPAHRQPVACTSATAPSGIHGADAEGPNTQA